MKASKSKYAPGQLLIFPFNGNGLEALSCLDKRHELIGFVDDTKEKQGANAFGFRVFSRVVISKNANTKILAVPGSAASYKERDAIIRSLNIMPERFATVIHPSANVSPLARIGHNVLIMAGVVITANAVIGDHVCILPNTVIHHDAEIGDYTLIGSNVTVAGYTKIGRKCYIGSGSSVINNISIGAGTLVGMATNVIRSFPADSKIIGNPAKQIK